MNVEHLHKKMFYNSKSATLVNGVRVIAKKTVDAFTSRIFHRKRTREHPTMKHKKGKQNSNALNGNVIGIQCGEDIKKNGIEHDEQTPLQDSSALSGDVAEEEHVKKDSVTPVQDSSALSGDVIGETNVENDVQCGEDVNIHDSSALSGDVIEETNIENDIQCGKDVKDEIKINNQKTPVQDSSALSGDVIEETNVENDVQCNEDVKKDRIAPVQELSNDVIEETNVKIDIQSSECVIHDSSALSGDVVVIEKTNVESDIQCSEDVTHCVQDLGELSDDVTSLTPLTEETNVVNVTEETNVENVTEETNVENVTEETNAENVTEETNVENVTEETNVENDIQCGKDVKDEIKINIQKTPVQDSSVKKDGIAPVQALSNDVIEETNVENNIQSNEGVIHDSSATSGDVIVIEETNVESDIQCSEDVTHCVQDLGALIDDVTEETNVENDIQCGEDVTDEIEINNQQKPVQVSDSLSCDVIEKKEIKNEIQCDEITKINVDGDNKKIVKNACVSSDHDNDVSDVFKFVLNHLIQSFQLRKMNRKVEEANELLHDQETITPRIQSNFKRLLHSCRKKDLHIIMGKFNIHIPVSKTHKKLTKKELIDHICINCTCSS
jgi:hypothetical protein